MVIVLCVEQGQSDKIPVHPNTSDLINHIPDYFSKATFNNWQVNVLDVLVRTTINDTAYAFVLPGLIGSDDFIPAPYVDTVLAHADAIYNFANYDIDHDGIVDYLAFICYRHTATNSRGTVGLPIDDYYTTNDVENINGTQVQVKIDGTDFEYDNDHSFTERAKTPERTESILFHEMGHSLFGWPDVNHNGFTYYNHWSFGDFDVMSSEWGGFNNVSSLYNPAFRAARGWVTPTNASGTQTFSDFDATGQIFSYALPSYSNALSNQQYFFTYYTKDQNNHWEANWEVPKLSDGIHYAGVLVWRTVGSDMFSTHAYEDRKSMPVTLECAHGKWDWNENNPPDIHSINTGQADILNGLDSLQVQYSYLWKKYNSTTGGYDWQLYRGNLYQRGSASCFFDPEHAKTFAFYTNPSSNEIASADESRSITPGFAMKNLRWEGGQAKADFVTGTDAYTITENATLTAGTWYINNTLKVAAGVTLTINPGAILNCGDIIVGGNLVVNSGATLTISSGTNLTFLSGASLTVNGTLVADTTFTIPIGSTMTVNPGSTVVFGLFTELIIRGMINANGATFTSNVQPRYSYGFVLVNATGSSFSNCTFSGVTYPIDDNASNPTIDHCTFNNWSCEDALGFYGFSPTITNCKFEGSSQTNNSIRFTANSNGTPSGGTVSNCVIENSGAGNGIVVMGGSSPVIVSDTIRNNHYHGIVVVENGSGRPNINSNILACNGVANGAPTYNGTDFYMSGGLLRLNAITGSNFGIYCDSYSSPSSTSNPPFGERGSNIVTNNRIGMNVYNHSYPVFGTTGPWGPDGGCNQIYGSTDYDIAATVSSIVTAEWNWWGQSPPNPNKFFTATNSTIDYSNWLPNSNCPFGGANIVKAPDRKTITSDPSSESTSILFQQAMIARSSGLYDTAKTLYRRILQITTTDVDRQHALVGLFNVFQESSDTSIVADFQSYSPRGTSSLKSSVELGQIAEELLGQSYMATKQIPKAHAVANDLIAKYPGTDLEKRALILIASLRAYDPSTDKISAEAVNELKKRFGSSIDQGLIAALDVWDNVPQIEIASPSASLRQSTKGVSAVTMSARQVEFQMENYPNPFNPSTMIRYQIPKAGKVILKVYDILGREVRTLVDAYQEVGWHSVQFNADNLASGIYFYRFSAPGINQVKKMILMK